MNNSIIFPYRSLLRRVVYSITLGFSTLAYSATGDLKDILAYALTADPRMLEAKANMDVAHTQTKISQAGHYPIVSVTSASVIKQKHDNEGYDRSSGIGLKGQMNIFSWGGIEAAVERDRHKESFHTYKYDETKEQLGKTIGGIYLVALRAKENIAIYQESLIRHQKMLKDVQIIAKHDSGRDSEIIEAQSRLLQVESILAEQKRILDMSLSQLNRYTPNRLTAENLRDPFAQVTPDALVRQYKNPDLTSNPTYQAQQKELESAKAEVKVARSRLLPSLNLEGSLDKKGYDVYVGMSWNLFDQASRYTAEQTRYSESAAKAKLDEILLEVQEQSRTSEISMRQNLQRIDVAQKQIASQRNVVLSYELQFEIARRSLTDVLNAYQELTSAQLSEANAHNDFRDAVLSYLVAQANLSAWAGVGIK